MNELVSDKKTAYILISALVVVLLGAVYYFVLHPLKNEKESKEVSIEVLQGEVAALKEEYSSSQLQDDSTENAFYLKTQVPLTRELNELIRSIEEVELLSESKILSVEFNNYDGTIEDAQLLPETSEENTETEPQSEDVLTDEPSEEPPVSPVAEASLPEKLKLITFNISILTKNYDQLVMFVEEIEHLKRIYRVDQITLLAPGEEQLLDKEAVNNIAAKIQLTTFYHDE
ncbi:potassium transporter [Psychrobacillus sp. FSL K6-1415]|uniref:potassium transporter n=1 Tax=Psychrobacillus sp. FSL K6-1415 TaxID=2921544 RepID=UPI0030F953C4